MPVKRPDPPRLALLQLFVRLNSLLEAGEEAHNELKKKWVEDAVSSTPLKRVLASMVPTLLFLKVNALFEDLINLLWKTRYPELEKTRPRPYFEEKLKVLGELHLFDPAKFKHFQDLRHKFAHEPIAYASWDQFDDYHAALHQLTARIYNRAYRRKKKKPQTNT